MTLACVGKVLRSEPPVTTGLVYSGELACQASRQHQRETDSPVDCEPVALVCAAKSLQLKAISASSLNAEMVCLALWRDLLLRGAGLTLILAPAFGGTAGPFLCPRIAQASLQARCCRAGGLNCRRRSLRGLYCETYFFDIHPVVYCNQEEKTANGEGKEPVTQTQEDPPCVHGKDYYASNEGEEQDAGQSQLPAFNNFISFSHWSSPKL
jgi:hypothetical protein